jgi:hypothetical protein
MDIAAVVALVDAEIDRLSRARALLSGPTPPLKRGQAPAAKRTMSPEGRARVAAAQRARWAKVRKKA